MDYIFGYLYMNTVLKTLFYKNKHINYTQIFSTMIKISSFYKRRIGKFFFSCFKIVNISIPNVQHFEP